MVVLVGPSGSGKSTWAAQRYRAGEIVSSDALRAVVGTGPHDLEASAAAFGVLDAVFAARTARRLTCVIDTLGLDPVRRRGYLARRPIRRAARGGGTDGHSGRGMPTPQCVSGRAGAGGVRSTVSCGRCAEVAATMADEGWDLVVTGDARRGAPEAAHLAGASAAAGRQSSRRASSSSSCRSPGSPGATTHSVG